MANEIAFAGVADLRTAEALSNQYLLLLKDRNSLPNHPALVYAGDARGRGSNVLKVPHLGLMGYDLLGASGDGSTIANTALTDDSTTVTVARYSKSYELTDLAKGTDPETGFLKPEIFAQDAVASQATTLVDIIANLCDGFSAQSGATGNDATVAYFLGAIAKLEIAQVEPPYMSILHPIQYGDIRSNVSTASAGAIQWMEASQQMLNMLGNGFKGSFAGVQIFVDSKVPYINGTTDRGGAMFGRGAIVWGDMTIPTEADPNQLNIANKVLFERDRNAPAGMTKYVTHWYCGASIGINAAGTTFVTSAS